MGTLSTLSELAMIQCSVKTDRCVTPKKRATGPQSPVFCSKRPSITLNTCLHLKSHFNVFLVDFNTQKHTMICMKVKLILCVLLLSGCIASQAEEEINSEASILQSAYAIAIGQPVKPIICQNAPASPSPLCLNGQSVIGCAIYDDVIADLNGIFTQMETSYEFDSDCRAFVKTVNGKAEYATYEKVGTEVYLEPYPMPRKKCSYSAANVVCDIDIYTK